MKKRSAALLTIILAACTAPVHAQQQHAAQPTANRSVQSRLPFRPNSADQEFKTEKLTAPIAFADVPAYSRSVKFLSGLRYPNDSTGQRTTMTVAVMEEASQVLDWYRAALPQYQWKLLPQSQDMHMVSAMKDGNTFSVMINPSHVEGYRTVMVLSLKVSNNK